MSHQPFKILYVDSNLARSEKLIWQFNPPAYWDFSPPSHHSPRWLFVPEPDVTDGLRRLARHYFDPLNPSREPPFQTALIEAKAEGERAAKFNTEGFLKRIHCLGLESLYLNRGIIVFGKREEIEQIGRENLQKYGVRYTIECSDDSEQFVADLEAVLTEYVQVHFPHWPQGAASRPRKPQPPSPPPPSQEILYIESNFEAAQSVAAHFSSLEQLDFPNLAKRSQYTIFHRRSFESARDYWEKKRRYQPDLVLFKFTKANSTAAFDFLSLLYRLDQPATRLGLLAYGDIDEASRQQLQKYGVRFCCPSPLRLPRLEQMLAEREELAWVYPNPGIDVRQDVKDPQRLRRLYLFYDREGKNYGIQLQSTFVLDGQTFKGTTQRLKDL
jgi:hypothetical protein